MNRAIIPHYNSPLQLSKDSLPKDSRLRSLCRTELEKSKGAKQFSMGKTENLKFRFLQTEVSKLIETTNKTPTVSKEEMDHQKK